MTGTNLSLHVTCKPSLAQWVDPSDRLLNNGPDKKFTQLLVRRSPGWLGCVIDVAKSRCNYDDVMTAMNEKKYLLFFFERKYY
jgi:hypothetical protein